MFNSDPTESQNHIPSLSLFFFFLSLRCYLLGTASANLHLGDKYDFWWVGREPIDKLELKLKPKPKHTKQSTAWLCQH